MSARRPKGGGTVRVIAGDHRGRRLHTPPGGRTRPTANRVREATFNALDSLGAVVGSRVLDGFAGSGALGIEALSRGALHATFAERDPVAVDVVASNIAALGLESVSLVVAAPLATVLAGNDRFDLVLLDPPYGWDDWPDLLEATANRLAPDGIVVVESDRELALPSGLVGLRSKAYGGTVVQFATPAGARP